MFPRTRPAPAAKDINIPGAAFAPYWHGFIIMHITSAVFDLSAPDLDACPPESLMEFAFIGRSNVGKSSLLNMLSGKKDLARVSVTPGHTKMINFFIMNKDWYLVDLPGYGFAQVARENRAKFNEAVSDYIANRPSLACVFVLIDSRHAPQAIDLEFVRWLGERSTRFVLVFTKTDKSKAAELKTNIDLFKEQMAAWWEDLPEIFTTSAVTGQGRAELLDHIEKTLAQGFSDDAAGPGVE
jgi:GTP-binding protein